MNACMEENVMKAMRAICLFLAVIAASPALAWYWGHPTYTPRTTCWADQCWNDAMANCVSDMQATHPHSYYFQRYGTRPRRWTHVCFTTLTRACHRHGTDVLTCSGDSAGGAFPSPTTGYRSAATTTVPPVTSGSFVGQYQFVGRVTYNDCGIWEYSEGTYIPVPFEVYYDDGYGDLAGTMGKLQYDAQGQVGNYQWSMIGQQCDLY